MIFIGLFLMLVVFIMVIIIINSKIYHFFNSHEEYNKFISLLYFIIYTIPKLIKKPKFSDGDEVFNKKIIPIENYYIDTIYCSFYSYRVKEYYYIIISYDKPNTRYSLIDCSHILESDLEFLPTNERRIITINDILK